jgi:hypothetical protein
MSRVPLGCLSRASGHPRASRPTVEEPFLLFCRRARLPRDVAGERGMRFQTGRLPPAPRRPRRIQRLDARSRPRPALAVAPDHARSTYHVGSRLSTPDCRFSPTPIGSAARDVPPTRQRLAPLGTLGTTGFESQPARSRDALVCGRSAHVIGGSIAWTACKREQRRGSGRGRASREEAKPIVGRHVSEGRFRRTETGGDPR